MTHVDEHTLELYVLEAGEVEHQKEAVKLHLLECAGCRSTEERLRAIYHAAERADEELTRAELSTLPVRVRRQVEVEPLWQSAIVPPEPIHRPFWTKVKPYAVAHPKTVLGGGALSFAALGGILALALNSSFMKPTPSFAHLNSEQDLIEVYAKDRTKLWSIPALPFKNWEAENAQYGTSRVEVADLDGNGRSELITTAPLAGMGSDQGVVRVFESFNNPRFERTIGGPVTFRGQAYLLPMNAYPLVIVQKAGRKESEIFVAASSGRSPTVIARLNAEGEIVGEYWHYGTLHGLYAIDVDGDGHKEVIASGTSDINDNLTDTGRSHAVLVVLDPEKLVGKQESGSTPGFGFEHATAERLYLRFPRSDMSEAMNESNGVRFVQSISDSLLLVRVEGGGPSGTPIFDYFLNNRTLGITLIQSSDANATLHAKLKSEGKIQSTLDEAYMKNLQGQMEKR